MVCWWLSDWSGSWGSLPAFAPCGGFWWPRFVCCNHTAHHRLSLATQPFSKHGTSLPKFPYTTKQQAAIVTWNHRRSVELHGMYACCHSFQSRIAYSDNSTHRFDVFVHFHEFHLNLSFLRSLLMQVGKVKRALIGNRKIKVNRDHSIT